MRRTRLERTADARTTTYGARSPHASSETPVLDVVLSHLFLHCNLEDSNNTRATRGLVDNYLQIAGAALAREPSPGIPPALSAHAHLRNGASILAALAPGRPTPLSLARSLHAKGMAAEGSAAALVLKAAEPWSPASHELFPDPARAHAVQLLLVGHSLSRLPKHESVAQAIFDIWLFHVMPHVVVRESE